MSMHKQLLTWPSKMSGMTCQMTQHYVSEDLNPQQCHCENLKSHADTKICGVKTGPNL